MTTPYKFYTHLDKLESIWCSHLKQASASSILWIYTKSASTILQCLSQNINADNRIQAQVKKKQRIVAQLKQYLEALTITITELGETKLPKMLESTLIAELQAIRDTKGNVGEDYLFATVHLICESLLAVICELSARATKSLQQSELEQALHLLSICSETFLETGQFARILEYLVHQDYHPLRVQLRDASGAQSPRVAESAIYISQTFEAFNTYLQKQNLTFLQLLDASSHYPKQYQLLCEFHEISRAFQMFLFRHYVMVSKILGSQSLGSLGAKVSSLLARAGTPLFPELDQAFYDYVQVTNFRHAHHSGSVVMAYEAQNGIHYPTPQISKIKLDPSTIENVIKQYFSAIETRNSKAWVHLFQPDYGTMRDTPNSKPFVGSDKLTIFIHNFFTSFIEAKPSYQLEFTQNNYGKVSWEMVTKSYNNIEVRFAGFEHFYLTAEGKIAYALAEWSPASVGDTLFEAQTQTTA